MLAGGLKQVDPNWRAHAATLGTPRWLAPLVPPVELVVGALVTLRVARVAVGIAAVSMLAGFTIFLLIKWEEHRSEPCNCFGALSKRPVTPWTIVRNLALMGLALTSAFVS